MLARIAFGCFTLAFSTTLLAADADHPAARFQVTGPTGVPGKVLDPGNYTIRVVDHLSDRYIVSVEGSSSKNRTLFLGIPDKTDAQASQGELKWDTTVQGTTYVKGWKFPNLSTPLEFAYPKNDAVAVAKANNAQVPAIDPESEGMVANAGLSNSEMHIITLWLLSPTNVGPNTPGGVQATRYSQVASNAHKHVIAKLPHTASLLPLVWLLGVLSCTTALGLRGFRLLTER